jgi:hypothetical protein
MRAKGLILVAAAIALLVGVSTSAGAAEKNGKPLNPAANSNPADPLASNPQIDNWRERAMRAHAEVPDVVTPPPSGTAQAADERGDRKDGEESGGGRLREDRGEGGPQE